MLWILVMMLLMPHQWPSFSSWEGCGGSGDTDMMEDVSGVSAPGVDALGAVSYTHLTLPTICSV